MPDLTYSPTSGVAVLERYPDAEQALKASGSADAQLDVFVDGGPEPLTQISAWRAPDGSLSGDDVLVDADRVEVLPALRASSFHDVDPLDAHLAPRTYPLSTAG